MLAIYVALLFIKNRIKHKNETIYKQYILLFGWIVYEEINCQEKIE